MDDLGRAPGSGGHGGANSSAPHVVVLAPVAAREGTPQHPGRADVTFLSGGERCVAWFYPARGPLPAPLVVMAHGLGATRELGLHAYASRFQAAGFAALVFDYRHHGASGGEPRELVSISRQLDDWRAALAFAKTLPGVDRERIAIWGSSFGGGHVLSIASEGHGVRAAIAQVPFSDGLASSLRIPLWTVLRVTIAALVDLARSALGLSPKYIGLIGAPGDVALMTAPDCVEGYRRLVPPDIERSHLWTNRVTARTGLAILFYAPARRVRRISMPILFCVAEQDSIAPAPPTLKAAAAAPRGELRRYPAGHFDYYVGNGFERIVADEIDFLKRHLMGSGSG
jgi:pimeloyl-ACP methyl ester carboxylesterase